MQKYEPTYESRLRRQGFQRSEMGRPALTDNHPLCLLPEAAASSPPTYILMRKKDDDGEDWQRNKKRFNELCAYYASIASGTVESVGIDRGQHQFLIWDQTLRYMFVCKVHINLTIVLFDRQHNSSLCYFVTQS